MRIALYLLCALSAVAYGRRFPSQESVALKEEWEAFKVKFSKSYSSNIEEDLRFRIFQQTRDEILEHNNRFAAGQETYELGINRFSDLLPREFENLMLRDQQQASMMPFGINSVPFESTNSSIPTAIDWRTVGALNPVRDQGQCGSCWAFAAVATLESHTFLANGNLPSLSEQNLVDCDTTCSGCGGGLASKAFAYIKSNGGIDTRESYPYEAKDGTCRYKSGNVGATLEGSVALPTNSEEALQEAVGTSGPVSVSIACPTSWQNYKSGVYNNPNCGTNTNHAVVVVGYGTDKDYGEFYIVRNSWGPEWGEDGYIRMARNQDNQCAIAKRPVYPIV